MAPAADVSGDPATVLAAALVAPRPWLAAGVRAWVPLVPGDRVRVAPDEEVTPATVLVERLRDPHVVTVPLGAADPGAIAPGAPITAGEPLGGSRGPRFEEDGAVLYVLPAGKVSAVVGRVREPVLAHADGRVAAVSPAAIEIVLAGTALPAAVAAGQATHGPLRLAVGGPGEELRPQALHVHDAGSVLVGGARVDVETVTRARAMGIHGIVTGGIAGHDLRDFAASEARQRAALHPLPSFALLVLEGFGRRSLAGPPFELLAAAAGSEVAVFTDPPLLVLPPGIPPAAPTPDTIRIASGEGAGATGSVAGPPAVMRFAEGSHLLAALFAMGERRWHVPLADLERFQ